MAIVFCRECNKEVSDKAKICPSCGISNPGNKAYFKSKTNCKSCNAPISGTPDTCKHCGIKSPLTEQLTVSGCLYAIFSVAVIIFIFYSCSGGSSDNKETAKSQQPSMTVTQKKLDEDKMLSDLSENPVLVKPYEIMYEEDVSFSGRDRMKISIKSGALTPEEKLATAAKAAKEQLRKHKLHFVSIIIEANNANEKARVIDYAPDKRGVSGGRVGVIFAIDV